MKLPIPSFFTKKDASNYYLSLLLRDEKTVAVVLKEIEGKLIVIGTSETPFTTRLEDIPLEDLLEILDKTISRAEEALPINVETEKTIFGVKDSWVEAKKIKKEQLVKLKKVCDALSLEPIGFMVTTEAISHLISKEEGAPLSAILAEVGKTQASLTLFRANKALETHSAPIDGSLTKTVDRLLHHFTTEVLPSRIVIFNGGHEETLAQEFLAHHWSKSIPFLHVPQISVLPDGFDGKSMIFGSAEQMGFSATEALGDIKAKIIESEDENQSENKESEEGLEEKKLTKKDKAEDVKEDGVESDVKSDPIMHDMPAGENFGFITNGDIATMPPPPVVHKPTEHGTTEKSNFSHVSASDMLKNDRQHTNTADQEMHSKNNSDVDSVQKKGIISSLRAFFATIHIPNPFGGGGVNKLFIIIPLILILLIGLTAYYLFTVKAQVTLTMQAKKIEDSTEITLRTDSGNDLAQQILSAKEVETAVEGTVSTVATGTKETGEKAKGTVTLYNSSDAKKTIPSGTILSSSNNLDYVVDKDTVIASASGDIFSGTKPGTVQTSLTAKNIGSEYNLPSGAKFNLSGSTSIAAKNDAAFSGGTKKELLVVSQKDIDKLVAELPKQLEDKARESLKGRASSDQAILPIFTNVVLSKKTLDNDLGDEAKKVTLKATVTFTSLSYSASDLKELSEAALKGKYEQNLAISDKGITNEIKNLKTNKNNSVSATLIMSAGLLPKLDKESIVENLTGKSFDDANDYLEQIPQVESGEIILSPGLPLVPKLLPRFSKNITVSLRIHE